MAKHEDTWKEVMLSCLQLRVPCNEHQLYPHCTRYFLSPGSRWLTARMIKFIRIFIPVITPPAPKNSALKLHSHRSRQKRTKPNPPRVMPKTTKRKQKRGVMSCSKPTPSLCIPKSKREWSRIHKGGKSHAVQQRGPAHEEKTPELYKRCVHVHLYRVPPYPFPFPSLSLASHANPVESLKPPLYQQKTSIKRNSVCVG